jgi:hypothetical protein
MHEAHTTLDWLDSLCDHALDEARQGNTAPANRLGSHPALAHYFNNVHRLRSITATDWAAQYPALLREAERLRTQDQSAQGMAVRLASLEAKLAKLAAQLSALVEE